jgi:hypothetical protein
MIATSCLFVKSHYTTHLFYSQNEPAAPGRIPDFRETYLTSAGFGLVNASTRLDGQQFGRHPPWNMSGIVDISLKRDQCRSEMQESHVTSCEFVIASENVLIPLDIERGGQR